MGWSNGTGTTSFKVVLAESWTTSLDGRVYTFKLSQGVKFNNGYPYDAPVVKYSIN
ncbi:MAG: ABC transporter substrate-binding protein [Candidatus Bathyarchaeia archaeon]